MKTWLSRFRMSAALDEPSCGPTSTDGTARPDQVEFHQSLEAIDRLLKRNPPRPEAPFGLRAAVMKQIREPSARESSRFGLRWAAGLSCALFLALGALALAYFHRPKFGPSPFTAKATVRMNREIAALPSAALAPLSKEWDNLSLDFQRTKDFLVSSVP